MESYWWKWNVQKEENKDDGSIKTRNLKGIYIYIYIYIYERIETIKKKYSYKIKLLRT